MARDGCGTRGVEEIRRAEPRWTSAAAVSHAARQNPLVNPVTVRGEYHPGHGGEGVPRAFLVGDHRIKVVEVLDCRPGRDHRYFKVQGNDRGLYILRHDTPLGEWDITLFEQLG